MRAVRPDAGKTIGLQLHPDLQAVGLCLAHSTLRLLDLRQQSQLVLDMMPDLVRNHIGLRELAGLAADIASAEATLEILKETRVKVHFLSVVDL